jgi:5-methyltetrahydrofolate--homocysteine methyltransferase
VSLARDAVAAGLPPQAILDAMTSAMQVVGGRFQRNEIYVPEMLIAARAMKEAMAALEPVLVGAGIHPEATAILGTVKGDLHDIGKNLVGTMLEGGGFEVIDLGVNVTPEQFVAAVKEKNANLIAMSALLTTTMPAMRMTIDALQEAGVRQQVKVLVGGAPITSGFAVEIGADGYSESAAGAVSAARQAVCA